MCGYCTKRTGKESILLYICIFFPLKLIIKVIQNDFFKVSNLQNILLDFLMNEVRNSSPNE